VLKNFAEGASAANDICPVGMPLLAFEHNVAHSNSYNGLRVTGEMAARTFPCRPTKNERFKAPVTDMFEENPAIEMTLLNFTSFQSGQQGVIADLLGQVVFRGFRVAESRGSAAFQLHRCNITQVGVTIIDWLIVGKTISSSLEASAYSGSVAIVTPRTNGFFVSNIRVHNFGSGTAVFQACSQCSNSWVWSVLSVHVKFEKIVLVGCELALIVKWNAIRRQIFWDLDGSLFAGDASYLIPYKAHLASICTRKLDWDDSL
jgi:hypothetical protein